MLDSTAYVERNKDASNIRARGLPLVTTNNEGRFRAGALGSAQVVTCPEFRSFFID